MTKLLVSVKRAAHLIGGEARAVKKRIQRLEAKTGAKVLHGDGGRGSAYLVDLSVLHQLRPEWFRPSYSKEAVELRTALEDYTARQSELEDMIDHVAVGAWALHDELDEKNKRQEIELCELRSEVRELKALVASLALRAEAHGDTSETRFLHGVDDFFSPISPVSKEPEGGAHNVR